MVKKVLRDLYPDLPKGSLVYLVNSDHIKELQTKRVLLLFDRYSSASRDSVNYVQFYSSKSIEIMHLVTFGGKTLSPFKVNDTEEVFGVADYFYVGKENIADTLDREGFSFYSGLVKSLIVK